MYCYRFGALFVGLLAGLALLVSLAPASQAANFTASSYPLSFTGESEPDSDFFIFPESAGVTLECTSHVAGYLMEASSTLEAEPTFSACTTIGLIVGKIEMTGCRFRLHLGSGSGNSFDLVCPPGKSMDVSTGFCKLAFSPQSGMGKVDLLNDPPTGISIQMTIEAFSYTVIQSGFYCSIGSVGTKGTAVYTQTAPVTLGALGGQTIDIG